MTVVVSDTSPLRALSHLKLLDLLGALFDRVLVPPAVLHELEHPKAGLAPVAVRHLAFVEIAAPQDQARVSSFRQELELAESQVIALALEVHAAAVLIDEAAGRGVAARVGLKRIGELGVLLAAQERKQIVSMAPLMDRLQTELRFFISTDLRREVLAKAGEAEG